MTGALLRDAVRLSVGTLTIAPVSPPTRLDRQVSGTAMLLAPLVGAALSLPASVVLLGGRWLTGGGIFPLLPAALAVGSLALLTRGMHLDGLADVADGLGVRRSREEALSVMRRPDVGAFAVATLVLVLLVQVVALAQATAKGRGTESLVTGLIVGRVVMTAACARGIPSARPDGLGATVAGSVSRPAASTAVAAVLAAAVLLGYVDAEGGPVRSALALLAGVAAATALLVKCLRRLGGINGDVLGALGEVSFTAVLVVMAASPDLGSPDWAWLFGPG